MNTYKILYLNGTFEDIKVFAGQWERLHTKQKGESFYIPQEWREFFKKYKIESTIFNLNSLEMFKGIVLTESQYNNLKGGLIKE